MRKVIFLNSILMLQVRPSCFHLMDYFTLTAVVPCMGLIGWVLLLQIVHEYGKFPVRNPGSIDRDHLIVIISSLWIRPLVPITSWLDMLLAFIVKGQFHEILCTFLHHSVPCGNLIHWLQAFHKCLKILWAIKFKIYPRWIPRSRLKLTL
jgi:hypothetical protein